MRAGTNRYNQANHAPRDTQNGWLTPMIHVVADSTVYRADPRREKAGFKAVARLAQGKHVTFHVPDIVRREFLSQEEEIQEKNAKAIQDSLKNLGKRPLDAAGADFLKKVSGASADMAAKLKESAAKEFADWSKSISAVDHPIDQAHGARVMDSYFDGTPPFNKKKNKEDIPDSFVWQAIQDLSKTHKPLYVVSGDGDIAGPLQGNKDFVVFRSLEDLIASGPIQTLLQQHYASANTSTLLALLPMQTALIADRIENKLIDELGGKIIGDDDSEQTITGVETPQDITVDSANAVDHGGGLAVVPFTANVECYIEFCIDKSAYYAMTDEKSEEISISDLNDHRFLAERHDTVHVEGSLSIQVDPVRLQAAPIDGEALLEILKAGTISIDSIDEIEFA